MLLVLNKMQFAVCECATVNIRKYNFILLFWGGFVVKCKRSNILNLDVVFSWLQIFFDWDVYL